MNKIINKFLLAGNTFMFEMHLYSIVLMGHSQKTIQNFKITGDSNISIEMN